MSTEELNQNVKPGDPPKKVKLTPEQRRNYYDALKAKNAVAKKLLGWGVKSPFGNYSSSHIQGGFDYRKAGYARAAKGSMGDNTNFFKNIFRSIGNRINPEGNYSEWSDHAPSNNLAWKAFEEQTTSDMLYNTTVGFTKQVGAGFLGQLGAIPGIFEMTNWSENRGFDVTGNIFQQWEKKLKESAQEENGIYTNGSMNNLAYWMNQVQNVGYTAGIFAETAVEQMALTWLTGGTGNALALGSKANLLRALAIGASSGAREAYMNSRETGEEIYTKLKQNGYDEAYARRAAGMGAWLNFKSEAGTNMALSAFSNALIFGGKTKAFYRGSNPAVRIGVSDAFETVTDKIIPNVTNKYLKKAVGLGVLGLSEGVEEVTQDLSQQSSLQKLVYEVNRQGEDLGKNGETFSALDVLKDFIPSDEFRYDTERARDAFIGGVLGSLVLAGAGRGARHIYNAIGLGGPDINAEREKALSNINDDLVGFFHKKASLEKKRNRVLNKMDKDPDNTDLKKELTDIDHQIKDNQKKSMINQIFNILKLDYFKGEGTVLYDTITSRMKLLKDLADTYTNANSTEQEKKDALQMLSNLGVDQNDEHFADFLETIQNEMDDKIRIAELAKDSFEDTLVNKTADFDVAQGIAKAKALAEEYKFEAKKAMEDVANTRSTIANIGADVLQEHTNDTMEYFDTYARLEALKHLEKSQGKLSDILAKEKKDLENKLKNYSDEISILAHSWGNKYLEDDIKIKYLVGLHKQYLYEELSRQQQENYVNKSKKSSIKQALRDKKEIEKLAKKAEKQARLAEKNKSRKKQEQDEKPQETPTNPEKPEKVTQEKPGVIISNELDNDESYPKMELPDEYVVKDPSTPVDPQEDPFEELINEMEGQRKNSEDIPNIDLYFSPYHIEDELAEKFRPIYDNLKKDLKGIPNAIQFINHAIGSIGVEKTKGIFTGLIAAYEHLSGKQVENIQGIYNQAFSEGNVALVQYAFSEEQAIPNSMEEAVQETKEAIKEVKKESAPKVVNPVTNIEKEPTPQNVDSVTLYPNRPDFIGVKYTEHEDENGNIIREDASEELFNVEENMYLLNPDIVKEGAEFTVLPISPEEYGDHKVFLWSDDYQEKKLVTFAEWLEIKGVEVGSDLWKAKVPMVATMPDGTRVFKIKDTEWYKGKGNVAPLFTDEVDMTLETRKTQHIKINWNIRKKVLASDSGAKIVIKHRKPGSAVTTLDDRLLPVKEANKGEIKLTVAKSSTDLIGPGKKPVETINSGVYTPGKVYEIREMGSGQNVAFPIFPNLPHLGQHLNDTAFNNVKMALQVSAVLNIQHKINEVNNTQFESEQEKQAELTRLNALLERMEKLGMTVEKAENIAKHQNLTFGDLKNNIGEYVNNFIYTYYNQDKAIEALNPNNDKVPVGTPIILWNERNQIFQIKIKDGKPVITDERGNLKIKGISLKNPNMAGLVFLMNLFEGTNPPMRNIAMNMNMEAIFANKPMHEILPDGTVNRYNGGYQDYITTEAKTNVLSYEIPTPDGGTKVITDVHPDIYFDLSENSSVEDRVRETNTSNTSKTTVQSNPIATAVEENKDKDNTGGVQPQTPLTENVATQEDLDEAFNKFQQSLNEQLETQAEIEKKQREAIQNDLDLIKGLDPEAAELFKDFKFFPNVEKDNLLFAPLYLDDTSEDINLLARKLRVPGLSVSDTIGLANSLFGTIFRQYLGQTGKGISKTVDLETLSKIANEVFNNHFNSLIELQEKRKNKLEELGLKEQPIYKVIVDSIEQAKNILEHKDLFLGESGLVTNKIERIIKINVDFDSDVNLQESPEEQLENDEAYDKNAVEKDTRASFSDKLKIYFSDVVKIDPTTQDVLTNSFGLHEYYSVDEVFRYLLGQLTDFPSSWEYFMNELDLKRSNPVIASIYEKLQNVPDQIKNEILYKMKNTSVQMLTVQLQLEGPARVIEENQNNTKNKLIREWTANLSIMRDSFLTKTEEGDLKYNYEKLNQIKEEYNAFVKEKNAKLKEFGKKSNSTIIEPQEIKMWLAKFGINASEQVTQKIASAGISGLSEFISPFIFNFNSLAGNNSGYFDASLFRSLNSKPLNSIAQMEANFLGNTVGNGFRVAGKNIQETTNPNLLRTMVTRLKNINSDYFQRLKAMPYSENNYMLYLLENDAEFNEAYDIVYQSIKALSIKNDVFSPDSKINEISEIDKEIVKQILFQTNRKTLSTKMGYNSGINLRVARMMNMTISDKDTMMLHNTPVLDLRYSSNPNNTNIHFDEDGNPILSDEVLDFLYNEIFFSEFKRIIQAYRETTNIKNYDDAAKRFLSLDAFNTLQDTEGNNIHDVIIAVAKAEGVDNIANFDTVLENFKDEAKKVLQNYLASEAQQKYSLWTSSGIEGKFVQSYLDRKVPKDSFESTTKDRDAQLVVASMDWAVNSLLNNQNQNKLIMGDLAIYSPSINKIIDSETKSKLAKAVDPIERAEIINEYFNTDPHANTRLLRSIGETQLKRMALSIAPGNILADSEGDRYLQIFVNDVETASASLPFYIQSMYGEVSEQAKKNSEIINKGYAQIEKLLEDKNGLYEEMVKEIEKDIKKAKDELAKEYPMIEPFLNITGTDAQEYTTWKEHLEIMMRQGKLPDEKMRILESAYDKLSKGLEVSQEELKVIMQPIKPVYTGTTGTLNQDSINEVKGVNRMVYVKSSSFPLIPQLTRGTKIDAVRRHMEEIQKRMGKNVRMSYQTANKIGAIDTALTMNDLYYNDTDSLLGENYEGILGKSILEMDRTNFKIQQEVPYKTDKFSKKDMEDHISMSTQMYKILMGNGISTIEGYIFDTSKFNQDAIDRFNTFLDNTNSKMPRIIKGRNINGYQIAAFKDYLESEMYNRKYHELIQDLDLHSNDKAKTITKLAKIIEEEIDARDLPVSLKDAVALSTDAKGHTNFSLPLWLNDNFDKVDSLIQSIVSNRVMKIKLPGVGSISTSGEGFTKTTMSQLDQKTKNGIIWMNPNRRGELQATKIEDGTIVESEVLLQSKFKKRVLNEETGKYETKLIDLREKDENGEYKYLKVEEDGSFSLKEGMIDPDLMQQFSFRIPVSSHQSGVILRVVGFLPEESADMIVLPKEHTTLLGEDYDVDKRYIYKSNYIVDEEGKITTLNSENKEERIQQEIKYKGVSRVQAEKTVNELLEENDITNMYRSVYSSPSMEVQSKINRVLSMDTAKETANLLKDILEPTLESNPIFSVYSDKYQTNQMNSGKSGKIGTAIHSLNIVFYAQAQRAKGIKVGDPLTIGNVTTSGIVGDKIYAYTDGRVKNVRQISDAHAENQNASVDNISAQIMFWRNENVFTINAMAQMTHRGFDKIGVTVNGEERELHLPSLLLSQPIIKRYVELKEEKSSQSGESIADSIEDILFEEFGLGDVTYTDKNGDIKNITKKVVENNHFSNEELATLTGEVLLENIGSGNPTKEVQAKTLAIFLQMEKESSNLTSLRSVINKGSLPASFIEINSLRDVISDSLMDLYNLSYRIENLAKEGKEVPDNLMERYTKHPLKIAFKITGEKILPFFKMNREQARTVAYSDQIFEYLRPASPEGVMMTNALRLSSAFNNPVYGGIIDHISSLYKDFEAISNVDNKTESVRNKMKFKLLNNLRDFVFSNAQTGLFTGTVAQERKRLFVNTPENMSLGMYIKNLKLNPKYSKIFEINKFLSPLMTDLVGQNKLGIDVIKFSQDFITKTDSMSAYQDFMTLIADNTTPLPDLNGVKMTPRLLAQELATYAVLAPQASGSIGFRNMINLAYFKALGFNKYININDNINSELFLDQFLSMNPNLVRDNKTFEQFITNNRVAVAIQGIKNTEDRIANASKFEIELLKESEERGEKGVIRSASNLGKYFTFSDDGHVFKFVGREEGQYKYIALPKLHAEHGYTSFNSSSQNTYTSLLDKVVKMYEEQVAKEPENTKLSKRLEILKQRLVTVDNQNNPEKSENEEDTQQGSFIQDYFNGATTPSEILKQVAENKPLFAPIVKALLNQQDVNSTNVEFNVIDEHTFGNLGLGVYNPKNHTVTLATNFDESTTIRNADNVALEEFIHAALASEVDRYVYNANTTEPMQKENAPIYIKKLVGLYLLARKAGVDVSNAPRNTQHYLKNIHEFIAGVFVDAEFAEYLDNFEIESRDGKNVSLLDRFKQILYGMVQYLSGGKFSEEVRNIVFEVLDGKFKRLKEEGYTSPTSNNFNDDAWESSPLAMLYKNDPTFTPEENKDFKKAVVKVNEEHGDPMFKLSDTEFNNIIGHDLTPIFEELEDTNSLSLFDDIPAYENFKSRIPDIIKNLAVTGKVFAVNNKGNRGQLELDFLGQLIDYINKNKYKYKLLVTPPINDKVYLKVKAIENNNLYSPEVVSLQENTVNNKEELISKPCRII